MYWANFLHIYQPPIQTKSILERITNESYYKIFAGLDKNPQAKLTVNINAGLTEMLVENGHKDLIELIRKLLERKQIELTATAKYHPLLPKLPPVEIIRQIQINEETNKKYFGPSYQPKGFFPPEMAYSPKIGKIIKNLGFKWIILDETALSVPPAYNVTYENPDGLGFFFRERNISFKILSAQLGTADILIKELGQRIKNNEYLLTAMDGETFGHHRPGLEELLWSFGNNQEIVPVTISQLLPLFPKKIIVDPQTTSWALTDPKYAITAPFLRWDDPENEIQQKQWEFVNLTIEAVRKDNRPQTRNLLDRVLYSDQFWWASARPWWSLEIIEKGAYGLLKVIQSCKNIDKNTINLAKDLYLDIVTDGFNWQRSGKVENLSRKEDEEMKIRMTDNSASLSEEDYKNIIENLTKQMLTSAKNQEYTRAEQIKERIKEIQERKILTKVNQ